MADRFGKEGLNELQRIDGLGLNLLNRLYLVTSIAANMQKFDPDLAQEFYNSQTRNINLLVGDIDKLTQEFQNKRGEI